jgi:hypothetical protein
MAAKPAPTLMPAKLLRHAMQSVLQSLACRLAVMHLPMRSSPDPDKQPLPSGHALRLAISISDLAVLALSLLQIGHIAILVPVTS